jgi:serine/threonine-protein kinase
VRPEGVQGSRWVGRVLRDKWRIDARIARGGMGTVFAATHRKNGSTAAIKILHPQFSSDADTRSRFLQEGYAANQVGHPGVVRILDDDVTEEGLAYLVMELLEGELLEQRRIRKGGKLPLVEVYEVVDQLLDVLAAAHAKGIVHRDVKPDNLFLTTNGKLKVLDFGFAQMKSSYRTEQTATGFLIGTPGFMAPEQAVGERRRIDGQTDVWAVGATMFVLLTGQPVHPGESAAEMLVAAANFPVRSITTLEPHLPTKLSAVIDRALAFTKDDRWPDARSLQAALRAVPGRQEPKEPIRRSIADVEGGASSGSDPLDEATLKEKIEAFAEVLEDRSVETQVAYPHPADQETPTLSVDGDRPTLDAPSPVSVRVTDYSTGYSETQNLRRSANVQEVDEDDVFVEGTALMEGRPLRPESIARAAHQPQLAPPAGDLYFRPPADPKARPAAHPAKVAPRPKRGARPAAQPSRILVYVLVGGISMIVVILTGLLVILGTE